MRPKPLVFVIIEKAPPELSPISTSKGEFFQRKFDKIIKLDLRELGSSLYGSGISPDRIKMKVKTFVAMSFREEEEPALVDYFNSTPIFAAL